MTRYVFVGHSSAVEGREDEYNDWYVNHHLPALLQCPGVISVRRFKVADAQIPGAPQSFKYLAIYEVETDDPKTFVNEVLARAATGRLPTSTAASAPGSSAVVWEELK